MLYLIVVLSASDDSDDESYGDWSKRMESYMNELSLLGIVIATTNRSTLEDDGIAFKDWSMKNALALYLILASFGSKADTLIGKIMLGLFSLAHEEAHQIRPKTCKSLVFC